MEPISRRTVLLGMGASAAALLGACSSATKTASKALSANATATTLAQTPPQAALGGGSFALFGQEDINFQTLFALGGAGQNAEVGEVLSVVAQANAGAGGPAYQNLYNAFVAMGNQLESAAVGAQKARHFVTARSQYFRAAQYYNQALYWVLGTSTPDAEASVYNTMNSAFVAGAKLSPETWEQVAIPYDKRTLPGWFVKPSADAGKRPTIILCNGSDGQNVDMLAQGGLAALERGYNILIFEGPGQGSLLFLDNIPFRTDWENVITPIVNFLEKRSDVDAKKIALRGISFGGVLAPRAAVYEKRIAALIADPGALEVWTNYPPVVRDVMQAGSQQAVNARWAAEIIPAVTPEQAFNLKKRMEIFTVPAHDDVKAGNIPTDFYSVAKAVQMFDITDLAKNITCPTLVTQYEGDTAFGTQPQALYNSLTMKQKQFAQFTAAQGAQYHCGPMAPQLVAETMWDWLDDTLDNR
ncbi:MAG: alpha/beta hydrolase family protein [Acidimicrobiia bacterium]